MTVCKFGYVRNKIFRFNRRESIMRTVHGIQGGPKKLHTYFNVTNTYCNFKLIFIIRKFTMFPLNTVNFPDFVLLWEPNIHCYPRRLPTWALRWVASVCMSGRALKGQRLELSTLNFVHYTRFYSSRSACIDPEVKRSKVKVTRLPKPLRMDGC